MKRLIALLMTALLFGPAVGAFANGDVSASERAMYAGDFKNAMAIADADVRGSADPQARFRLLLQRVRIQQLARLSGLPDVTEASTLAALRSAAGAMPKELRAQARFTQLVSTYFRRLTKAEAGDFLSLQPSFRAVANELTDPCRKADAQFFTALMPQVQGKVGESAAGLEQARKSAAAAGCELELSYALRHLASVAEEEGKLDKAFALAEESLAIRRRIKFEVFLPYSLLHSADIMQARGDAGGAKAYRKEALAIATRIGLPAQTQAAREALAGAK